MKEPASSKKARRGRVPPEGGAVTMATVGRMAGVSQVTVSRALSNPEKVSAETMKRIQEAIRVTGFVPNALAGALASRKSSLITALVPSITNVVYSSLLHGFSEIMRAEGYQLMVSETGFLTETEEALIFTHLSRRPDGILLTGIHHSAAARKMLLGAGIPVVEFWDITQSPVDCCVGFSHTGTGRRTAELAHGWGYRRAATVSAGDERALRRRDGFRNRFAELTGGSNIPGVTGEAPVGQAQMRHAAARDADHHRLHHGQRQERGDGGIDRVAAERQHLLPGCGAERMVGHDDAARRGGRQLAAGEGQREGGGAHLDRLLLPAGPARLPPLSDRSGTPAMHCHMKMWFRSS